MDSYNTEKRAIPSHCVEHMHAPCSGRTVDAAMCVMNSLPVASISSYAPPAHRRASGAASGGALGRSAPPRAARAPPFSFLPNTEKLPHFLGDRVTKLRGAVHFTVNWQRSYHKVLS